MRVECIGLPDKSLSNIAARLKYYHIGCMTPLSLKDARLAAGLTQAGLARAINTTTMQIWRFEKGHRPVTLSWARLLAPVLKVADPASLVSNMDDFPDWGRGRPAARGEPRVLDGRQEAHGDFVQDDLERMILRFWRGLSVEGKDLIITEMTAWSRDRVRERALGADGAGQLAINE